MPTSPFIYNGQPSRVIFGQGSLQQLEAEIDRLGAKRALVLCTPEQRAQAENIARLLGSRAADIFDKAVMHVPIETAREARELARKLGADCAVAIGGGSTTGLGKAIAMDSGLPILAIPTTYAGSEMTPVFGLTENGLKRTGKDPRVLPKTVIYDPELTVSLPVDMSITSGMNAIAHAAEGLYAQDGNPVMSLMAEEGIRALAAGHERHPSRHPAISTPAAIACTAPGSAAPCSATSAWRCITSFAIRWAAASTCPMHKPTPSCCRMPSPTTSLPPRGAVAHRRGDRRRDCSPAAALFDCPVSWAHRPGSRPGPDRGRPGPRHRHRDIQPLLEPEADQAVAIRQLLQDVLMAASTVSSSSEERFYETCSHCRGDNRIGAT